MITQFRERISRQPELGPPEISWQIIHMYKKTLAVLAIGVLAVAGFIYGTQKPSLSVASTFNSSQVGSSPVNGSILQTNGTVSTWVTTSSLGSPSTTIPTVFVSTFNGASGIVTYAPSTTIPVTFVSTFNGASGIINYAPSTTIATNNNQLTNGSNFIRS